MLPLDAARRVSLVRPAFRSTKVRCYAVVAGLGAGEQVRVTLLDEDRARAWVVVRMVHNASWTLTGPARRTTAEERA